MHPYYLGLDLPAVRPMGAGTELDPGIRDVVAYLRLAGFDTTDSGDGHSKHAEIFDGEALDYAHVFATVKPEDALCEARRMLQVLQRSGFDVEGLRVQATYDPAEGSAILAATWPRPLGKVP